MRFCVKCGKDCDDIIDGLCVECFLEGRQLMSMPHHVDLQVCTNCGEYHLRDEWVCVEKMKVIEDTGIEQLSVVREARVLQIGASVDEQDKSNYLVRVQARLDVSGVEIECESSIIVRVKNTVCKRCSRILGNYYESILQIRTCVKELSSDLKEEVLARVENYVANQAETNRNIFISKMELVTGGVDVYLSSIQLGKALAKMLTDSYSAETKEASKLVGQTRDGQEMYRLTYLVRLPNFHVWDVVSHSKHNYVLVKVSNSGGKLVDLSNFKERTIKRVEMNDLKVITKAADLTEVTVVSKTGSEIQIIHPTNYSTLDLILPEGTRVGETVKVVDIDGTIYYVPSKW
ncbi:MAG: hypothetical protein KRP56_00225 [Candidatus Methanogranum gryphiswaldense]|nr:MAG: hypothetical protein KRP56_00225 [Candidatus Methanogranum sp. U3.2.1]